MSIPPASKRGALKTCGGYCFGSPQVFNTPRLDAGGIEHVLVAPTAPTQSKRYAKNQHWRTYLNVDAPALDRRVPLENVGRRTRYSGCFRHHSVIAVERNIFGQLPAH